MRIMSLRSAALALTAAIGLGGCSTYGMYGSPYGGLSVGYGNYDPYYGYGYGYSPYGYSRYGYNSGYFGSPYWGWYDDFYYPGTGYYVYDRYRRPHRWSDSQRVFWTQRQRSALGNVAIVTKTALKPNWSGFSTRSTTSASPRTTTTTTVRDRTVTPRFTGARTFRERPARTETVRERPTRAESRFDTTSDVTTSPRRGSRRRDN